MSDNINATRDAADRWNAAFFQRFYAERAAAIRASGDVTRIRLLEAWEAKQRGRAA